MKKIILILIPLIFLIIFISYKLFFNKGKVKGLTSFSSISIVPSTNSTYPGNKVTTQAYLSTNDNLVYGVDLVIRYDVNYLSPDPIIKPENSQFGTFTSRIDSQNGLIEISLVAFDTNQQIVPINQPGDLLLANIDFTALATTPVSQPTLVSVDYIANSTTDSNISVITDEGVVDALTDPQNATLGIYYMGDSNRDGYVNILDYQLLSSVFGSNDDANDFNGDDIVNILDFIILSNNFGIGS